MYINIPVGILQPICAICPKPLNTSRQNNTCTPFKYTYSDIRYMYCTKVPTKNPNPLFKVYYEITGRQYLHENENIKILPYIVQCRFTYTYNQIFHHE